jgi:hypothetical protein
MRIADSGFKKRRVLFALSMSAVALALVVAWQWSARANSSTKDAAIASCKEVGERPAIAARRIYPQMGKLIAGPIVVGCGRTNHEWIQLVAFHTSKETCVELERPRQGSISGGECKANGESWGDVCGAVCIFGVLSADENRRHQFRRSIVSGQIPVSSDSMEIRVGVNGHATVPPVVEARVDTAPLLKNLSITEPFVVFGTVLPRCVSPHEVQLVTTNGGHIVKKRGLDTFRNPCAAPQR